MRGERRRIGRGARTRARAHLTSHLPSSSSFHNWLESARDWAVSRSRFWGTPLPVWTSADGSEVVVIGSVAELEARTGATGVTDLHRHHVDALTIPSATPGNPPLTRVDDVFDCWFESGAMPYASAHYPFEARGEAALDGRFPADFVAEGLDQTRGWFYTLMVGGVEGGEGGGRGMETKENPDPTHPLAPARSCPPRSSTSPRSRTSSATGSSSRPTARRCPNGFRTTPTRPTC